jgi:hypothetical protein
MTGIGSGRTRSLPLMIGHSQGFKKAHVHLLDMLRIGIFITNAAENAIGARCGFLSQFPFSSFSGYREACSSIAKVVVNSLIFE